MEFDKLIRTVFFFLLASTCLSFAFSSLSPLASLSINVKVFVALLSLPLAYGLSALLSKQLERAEFSASADEAVQATQAEVEFLFIKSLFISLGRLAASDNDVCENEQAYVKQLIDQLNLCENYSIAAADYFQMGVLEEGDWLNEVSQFAKVTLHKRELQQVFFETLIELTEQNGTLTLAEFSILQSVRQLLLNNRYLDGLLEGLQPQTERQADQQSEQAKQSTENSQGKQQRQTNTSRLDKKSRQALHLLGLRDDATVVDIKKRYRQLMKAHHPDRLIAEGLPEELLEKATERAAKINKAYRILKQSMNFR